MFQVNKLNEKADPIESATASTAMETNREDGPVIFSMKEYPEYREAFITYISEAWPALKDVAIAQMKESQLIEQELLVRKDLSPWIAPLFIDKSERGQGLGALLLQHARKTVGGQLGYDKVILTTDHIQYYEKYGFREIGLSQFEWGRPSKIYEHDTLL